MGQCIGLKHATPPSKKAKSFNIVQAVRKQPNEDDKGGNSEMPERHCDDRNHVPQKLKVTRFLIPRKNSGTCSIVENNNAPQEKRGSSKIVDLMDTHNESAGFQGY